MPLLFCGSLLCLCWSAICKRRSDNVPRRRLDSLNVVSLFSINVTVNCSA